MDIGPSSGLADGVPLSAEVDGIALVVVRCGSGLYAVEDRCTHDGESFTGAEVENCELVCPRHGSHFSLQTGEALTPPAYEALRTYAVREQDGRLLIEQT